MRIFGRIKVDSFMCSCGSGENESTEGDMDCPHIALLLHKRVSSARAQTHEREMLYCVVIVVLR